MSKKIPAANQGMQSTPYRCTRGCGEVLGHPSEQDEHNERRHLFAHQAGHDPVIDFPDIPYDFEASRHISPPNEVHFYGTEGPGIIRPPQATIDEVGETAAQ